MAIDPVCGMQVDPAVAKWRAEHAGRTFYFCGQRCRDRFVAEPLRYRSPAPHPAPHPAPATVSRPTQAAASQPIYTCPMHPEIRQQGPGHCPLCGMALEPLQPAAEPGASAELTDLTRRLWVGALFTAPLVALDMAAHAGMDALHHSLGTAGLQWVEALLAAPAVLWAGAPLWRLALASLRHRALNMYTLIGLGTAAAFFYSLVARLAPGAFPPAMRPTGAVPVYFEAAATITVLVLLGQVLELRDRERTGGAIRALLRLSPPVARRVDADGRDAEIPLAHVHPGDTLRIRPGERVPVDGMVLEGRSAVDESMLTGESVPVAKLAGAHVIGGTLNGTGALLMRAERVGADTMLARIVQLVAEAQRSRAPVQRLADAVSAWFVPAVMVAALLAFAGWWFLGPEPVLAHALVAAVSVLIIACPCALGLATPMSIMVGVGRGATLGVLIRNAEALERLERVDTLVLDKTGTLTEGRPRVVGVEPALGFDVETVLARAAAVERSSEHPLAAAIVQAAAGQGAPAGQVVDFAADAGGGVSARVGGEVVVVGSEAFAAQAGAAAEPLRSWAEARRQAGASVVFVVVGGRLAGGIAIADPIKSGVAAVLAQLRAAGLRILMLTGDNRQTAEAVAAQLGITEIEAGVLPAMKQQSVQRLRDAGRVVAMAGDGVNDAPALAAADICIAMGTGTDVAMASAGVTLVKGDIAGIVRARRLSRATMRNIRQNLALAFVYNTLGVPVAAGVLYPAFGLLLSPVMAAAAMSLSSVCVIGNALRLRWQRI